MALAKHAVPLAVGSNIAGTTLDSLANGSASAFVTYDNTPAGTADTFPTSLGHFNGSVRVTNGSLTPTTAGSITLVVFACQNGVAPDNTASINGGERYTAPLTTTTGAKETIFPFVRMYNDSMRFSIVNNSGVAFAATGNAIYVRAGTESMG